MKKIILLLVFVGILLFGITSVNAGWICGNVEYDPCPSAYPQECCVDGISICLDSNQDCGQHCCIGGGCDSWDDFWFCNKGSIANCDVETTHANRMACCPSQYPVYGGYDHCCTEDYPIYNPEAKACWKVGWECTKHEHCSYNQYCSSHKCVEKECDSGEEMCVSYDSYSCSNYKWINKGKIKGKCGVECLSESDCGNDGYVGSKFCSGDNVVQNYRDYSCFDYRCEYSETTKILEQCDYMCSEGVCIVKVCDEGETKCVGDDLMVCTKNQFVLKETCKKGCEEGKCIPEINYLLIGIIISVMAVAIGIGLYLIFRKKR